MKEHDKSHRKPNKKFTYIFILLSVTNILINIDHGIIPAGIFKI